MYVDESGCPDIHDTTQYFVTCGTIFQDNDLTSMKERVQNYKDTHFTGALQNAEIHLYNMWKGNKEFYGLSSPQKKSLLDPLYNMINQLPCTIIATGIDKPKFVTRHRPDQILEYSYMLLVERFDNFLHENNSRGLIRVDQSTNPKDTTLNQKDSLIFKTINRVRKRGTNWQKPAVDIVEEPDFLHSHTRKGLQLADAVAYCTTRKTNNHSDFDTYWKLIYPKFRKNNSGTIEGYGFRIYPK